MTGFTQLCFKGVDSNLIGRFDRYKLSFSLASRAHATKYWIEQLEVRSISAAEMFQIISKRLQEYSTFKYTLIDLFLFKSDSYRIS